MRWLKVGIALAGVLLFLVLMVWVPLSASAHGGALGSPIAAPLQVTPTVDLTVTALAKEQLALQVKQLQSQMENQNNWLANNSTALIAAAATVIVALFGILQWAITTRQAQDKEFRDRADAREKEKAAQEKELKDRQEAQDKELRAQAEERFKTAVTALGDANEATQISGAILLRSFLNPRDEEIYGRYYAQIFDLAVAYLRLPNTTRLTEDPDGLPPPPADHNAPVPLALLRKALITVFKEVFPLARDKVLKEQQAESITYPVDYFDLFMPLNATDIQLDNAYLSGADLKQVQMLSASLREATLQWTNLSRASLSGADFTQADLMYADLTQAYLTKADFTQAFLAGANLSGSNLYEAHLTGADLHEADLSETGLSGADLTAVNFTEANLSGANLTGTNIEEAQSLDRTNLRGVKGLTKKQLLACKTRGAIIDEDTMSDSSHPPISSAQAATPLPSTDGSTSTTSQPNTEP